MSNIFRYEVATGDGRGGVERGDGLLPAGAARRRAAGRARPTPAEGFVPAIIEPRAARGRERDHVPRRRGRGEAPGGQDVAGAAAEHASTTRSWSPARAPTSRCAASRSTTPIPVLQGYKDSVGIGYHFNFADPLGFASLGITAAVHAGRRPARRASAGTSRSPAATSAGAATLSWNRSDFYDLFGPTKRSRKGYAAKLGYDRLADLRRAAHARRSSFDVAYYDQIDTLPERAERRAPTSTRLLTGEVGAPLHRRAALARRRRRREGRRRGTLVLHGQPRQRRDHAAGARRRSTSASPLPLRALVDLAAHAPRARRAATATTRSRTSTSAASATTTSTDGRVKRYREYDSLPGLRHQRGQRPSASCARWSSGTCRRTSSSRRARRPSTSTGCGPSVFAAGAVDRPGSASRCARTTRASARRSTCASRVLHWYDMTLSAGYAVGFRGAAARRRRVDDLAEDHVSAPPAMTV